MKFCVARGLTDDELLVNLENLMAMGIFKIEFDDLTNEGFSPTDAGELMEDKDYEEDDYGFKLKKIKKVAVSGKDKEYETMINELKHEYKDVFTASLKDSHIIEARNAIQSNNITKEERKKNAPRSFTVRGKDGGVYLRNAKFIKLNNLELDNDE